MEAGAQVISLDIASQNVLNFIILNGLKILEICTDLLKSLKKKLIECSMDNIKQIADAVQKRSRSD